MKKLLHRLAVIAENPQAKPLEIWALRALLAYVGVKLGIDVKDLAK